MNLRRMAAGLALLACAGAPAAVAHAEPAPDLADVHAKATSPGWDRYVEYLHRMAESIENGWVDTAPERTGTEHGSAVVQLVLDRHGNVVRMTGFSALPDLGVAERRACRDAILAHGPFAPWTDAMAKVLGPESEIAVEFDFR